MMITVNMNPSMREKIRRTNLTGWDLHAARFNDGLRYTAILAIIIVLASAAVVALYGLYLFMMAIWPWGIAIPIIAACIYITGLVSEKLKT